MTHLVVIDYGGYPTLRQSMEVLINLQYENPDGDGFGNGDYTFINAANGWGYGSFIFGGNIDGSGSSNWGDI